MDDLKRAKRIVVKVGTSTLTHESGLINIRRVENLVKVLADLKIRGKRLCWSVPAPLQWALANWA